MADYEEERVLNFNHIDNHGVARPSTAFDVMQDAATNDALRLGLDKDTLGVLWVLSRMQVWQTRPFYPEETILVRTHFDGVKGINWCRSFTLLANGEEIAHAHSTWIMLDPVTHSMLRPRQKPELAVFPALGRDYPTPEKLSCDTLRPHHVHTVRYSDLDRNNHLNNVKIVDVIADGLDFDGITGQFVSEIQVNYAAECVCGEQITLSAGQDENGTLYVFGAVNGISKFEAAARLSAYRERGNGND